jgi:hypothetical protein
VVWYSIGKERKGWSFEGYSEERDEKGGREGKEGGRK